MDDEIRDGASDVEDTMPDGDGIDDGADSPPDTPSDAVLDRGDTSKLTAIEESLQQDSAGEEPPADDDSVAVGDESDSGDLPEEGELSPETTALLDSYAPAGDQPADPSVAAAVGETPIDEVAPSGIDMGPERSSNMWIWVGLAIGVLIAAAAIGYAWWYMTSRPIVVPDVVGKLPAQATQTLNDADLRLGNVTEQATDTAAAGTVIAQSPDALEETKPGATVSLVVAAPPETMKVPDVTGKTYDEAASTLVAARLNPKRIDAHSPTVAAGLVASQLPTMGASVPPGGSVALVVSLGQPPTSFRVPQLTGLPSQDAAALLAPLDVTAKSYRSSNNSITAGIVVTQTPLPGSQVLAGGAVQYLISDGPGTTPVTVPDVVGDTRKEAESALKAKGLKAEVREVPSATVPKGDVISQMPPGGSKTASGGIVGLIVSKGNLTQAAVPGLVGKASDEASKAIAAAGFKPVMVEIVISDQPAGKVFMQFPAPSTSWPLRFPVVCLVAKAP